MEGRFAVLVAAVVCAVLASDMTVEQPFVLGTENYGYSFALQDGNGNVIVATNPAGDHETVIIKAAVGATTPQHKVSLLKSKGRVTCGCILGSGENQELVAGLSVPGYAVRINLSFPANSTSIVRYLNATDETLLWNGGSAQNLVSAVCKDNFVYFGTKGNQVPATILRLDTASTDSTTRFQSLGPVAPGDLTFGALWGDDEIVFVMEPDNATPLTFITITTGASWSSKHTASVSTPIANYDLISGMHADHENNLVTIANAIGDGHIGVFNLSKGSVAELVQDFDLASVGHSPISSFVVDADAHMAYATMGTCASEGDVVFVAVRLAPTLALQTKVTPTSAVYNCATTGLPVSSVLVTSATKRQVFAFTQVDYIAGQAATPGGVITINGFSSGNCPEDCHENDKHGVCVASKCFCAQAFSGPSCGESLPCGGTQCSSNGVCVENTCVCNEGFEGDHCENVKPCPLGCSNRGTCAAGVCACSEGFIGSGCEYHTVGCETLSDCSGHGHCEVGYPVGSCVCEPGFTGKDCSENDVSCPNACSGHGTCVSGVCKCENPWVGANCSLIASSCPNNCSSHGVCRNDRCTCFHGYKGLDCSTVDHSSCAFGCSGHGSCVNGMCVCQPGWKGANCTSPATDLTIASETVLLPGENVASTGFIVPADVGGGSSEEVVFCTASVPGKCVAFEAETMQRLRAATFVDQEPPATAILLEDAEGRGPEQALAPKRSIMPDISSLTSVSMMQIGSNVGEAPIAVAVSADPPASFVILGTAAASNSTPHGQLIKISSTSFARLAQTEFDDDAGLGVTAGCSGGDDTYFFASGSSPAIVYRVDAQLEILSRISVACTHGVSALVYDGTKLLSAACGNSIHILQVSGASLEVHDVSPTVTVASALGDITTGFVHNSVDGAVMYFGTAGVPAAVIRVELTEAAPRVQSIRLKAGEDRITSVAHTDDFAFFGLGVDGSGRTCFAVKVSLTNLREVDMIDLKNCTADLISATISPDGSLVYFGNAASPAHVFVVRLFPKGSCPSNCSHHGVCVEGSCHCNSGWTGLSCSTAIHSCPNNCSRAGKCVGGVCQCNAGHSGSDCSIVELCSDKCVHGQCTGAENTWPCTCESSAWTGDYCSEANPATLQCPNACSQHGTCVNGVCQCDSTHQGNDCATAKPTDACSSDSECGHGVCLKTENGTKVCHCEDGWQGSVCNSAVAHSSEAQAAESISPALIGVLVAAAVIVGMVAGVAIWKSSMAGGAAATANPGITGLNGPSRVASGGYTRLPRRLVK